MKRSSFVLFVVLFAVLLSAALVFSACGGTATTTTVAPTTTTTAKASTTSSAATTTTGASTTASATSTTAAGLGPGKTFTANLTGDQAVPAVNTEATGLAVFTVDPSGTKVRFSLTLHNISDVIFSRVRVGKPGENGPAVLILFAGPKKSGVLNGGLAGSSFKASVMMGPLQGKTIADLQSLFQSGQAYVVVGTAKHPNGEVRGQIR